MTYTDAWCLCRCFNHALHWENYVSISFQIEWDMIGVTGFILILNRMEFHLVQNQKKTCHHDRVPFDLKGNGNIVFSVFCCSFFFLWNFQTSFFRSSLVDVFNASVIIAFSEFFLASSNYWYRLWNYIRLTDYLYFRMNRDLYKICSDKDNLLFFWKKKPFL